MSRPKVIGVGLNKTGTKTLADALSHWGYRNASYSIEAFQLYQRQEWGSLREICDQFDSFEDWPWPLMSRQFDAWYPDAKFVLTVRNSAEKWFRSLCRMYVRFGPLVHFEQHIYGHAIPQGQRQAHIDYYTNHNSMMRTQFAQRPDKLLELCWENGDGWDKLAHFVGHPTPDISLPHRNRSGSRVYSGNNRLVARANFHAYRFYRRQIASRIG